MWENSVEMETRQWAIKRRQKREPKRFQEGCAWTLGATIPQNAPKTKLIETRELPHFTFTLGKSEDNGTSSTTELSGGDKSSSCPEEREWCMPQKNSGVIAECLCLQAVWEEGSEILGWGVGEGLAGGVNKNLVGKRWEIGDLNNSKRSGKVRWSLMKKEESAFSTPQRDIRLIIISLFKLTALASGWCLAILIEGFHSSLYRPLSVTEFLSALKCIKHTTKWTNSVYRNCGQAVAGSISL